MKYLPVIILLLGHAALALAGERPKEIRLDYWNVQKTPEHVYRVVRIGYLSMTDDDEMIVSALEPPFLGLSRPQTRAECREDVRDSVDATSKDYYRENEMWSDRQSGMIGDENRWYPEDDNLGYSFMRFICLPMDQINDLDLIGNQYEHAIMEKRQKQEQYDGDLAILNASYLVLPDDDPRHFIRYDADRFFARFEKYGVTRTLVIPPGEWKESPWKNTFFIFPLDQSNE